MGDRGFVEVERGRLAYQRNGDGPALVLLAGGMSDMRQWTPQVDTLARHATLIRCDLRGYGRSSTPTEQPYRHVDDLRLLLDGLGIDRAHIAGQSFGGTIAVDFALTYPELVAGLILAPVLPLPGWRWTDGSPVASAIKLARTDGVDAAKAAFLELPLNASAMANPEIATTLARLVADYSGWHLHHPDPGQLAAPDAIDHLAEITAPTLVIVGGLDVPDAHLIAEHLATTIERVEHHLIDHVGHYPNLEDPNYFNQLTLNFLKRTTR